MLQVHCLIKYTDRGVLANKRPWGSEDLPRKELQNNVLKENNGKSEQQYVIEKRTEKQEKERIL